MSLDFLPVELVALLGESFWHMAIVFLRVGSMVFILPVLGERFIPNNVKLIAALMFAVIVAPSVPVQSAPASILLYAGLAVSEGLIGLALGFVVRLFVMTLQTLGAIAAQSTSLAQVFGGLGAEPMPAMGSFLFFAGTALAVLLGLHIKIAEFMINSYILFPIGEFPPAAELAHWIVDRVSKSFSMSFSLAAPFLITAVIYNLTLGFINRAMPQLMVSFVGAPVIILGSIFILMVASPLILTHWVEVYWAFFANPVGDN